MVRAAERGGWGAPVGRLVVGARIGLLRRFGWVEFSYYVERCVLTHPTGLRGMGCYLVVRCPSFALSLPAWGKFLDGDFGFA